MCKLLDIGFKVHPCLVGVYGTLVPVSIKGILAYSLVGEVSLGGFGNLQSHCDADCFGALA